MLARTAMLTLFVAGSMSGGCHIFRQFDPNSSTSPQQGAPQPATTTSSQARVVRPIGAVSDANIAAMVLALNNTDISYARLAPARAERADVKRFAERMLSDHTGVNGLVTALLQKLDMAAEDNVASLDMRDESAENRDIMRDLSGYAFDSTYIENEVRYHRKFLAQIDEVMLPSVRHPELRNLLTAVRPAVASHMAHAEQVRADVIAKR